MCGLASNELTACYSWPLAGSVLLELQRYFRAAAEAAHEVLAEQGSTALDSRLDVSKFSEAGKALDSPSRMVALNLANGNPLFRYVWSGCYGCVC